MLGKSKAKLSQKNFPSERAKEEQVFESHLWQDSEGNFSKCLDSKFKVFYFYGEARNMAELSERTDQKRDILKCSEKQQKKKVWSFGMTLEKETQV